MNIQIHVRRRKERPRKSARPVLEGAATLFLDQGLSRETVGARTGLGHHEIELAVERERGRREAEPQIKLDDLSLTAKQKLDIAVRQHKKMLEAEHDERLRLLDEEVRLRVVAEGAEYLATVREWEAKAKKVEEFYRRAIGEHRWPLTEKEWMSLIKVSHPDNSASNETRGEVFRLITARKLQLTGKEA